MRKVNVSGALWMGPSIFNDIAGRTELLRSTGLTGTRVAAAALALKPVRVQAQESGCACTYCAYFFFTPAVKFVTTVTDWLTCCETLSRRIFFPSGLTS